MRHFEQEVGNQAALMIHGLQVSLVTEMLIQNEDLFGALSTAINEVNIIDSHAKRNELLGRYNYCYYHIGLLQLQYCRIQGHSKFPYSVLI